MPFNTTIDNSENQLIEFLDADIDYPLDEADKIRQWLLALVHEENCTIQKIQYIFCTDEYLLEINKQFLNHDYYTDIITFPFNSNHSELVSDIYISIDRIKENALSYKVPYTKELYRVMAHGLLHLCGYGDATVDEKPIMRNKEDYYLNKLNDTFESK